MLKKIIYKWRVRVGSLAALAALILARPTFKSIILGFMICLLGLFVRTWACGHIQKEEKLSVSGPYRYTRNPLYLGNLIIGIGVTAGSCSWLVLGIFCLYFLVFYPVIINIEKHKMEKLFPKQYESFKQVPLFIPSLKAKLPPDKKKFKWSLFSENKEYRAFIGVTLFWVAMIIKIMVI
ncbi:MAG: isoprenylcysteine carboxylmethyltransferase family protein [Candidatus Aminicenantes bacterium]